MVASLDSVERLCVVLRDLERQIESHYPDWSQLVDWVVCRRFNQIIAASQELATPGLLPEQIEENDQPSAGGMLVILGQTLQSLDCPQRRGPTLASPGFFDD